MAGRPTPQARRPPRTASRPQRRCRTPTLGPRPIEAAAGRRTRPLPAAAAGCRDRTRRRRSAPGRWPAPGTAGRARWPVPLAPPPARRRWQRRHGTQRHAGTPPDAPVAPRRPASLLAAARRPRDDPARPQQHRRCLAGRLADQVDAEVHAVGEVDVRVPGLAEHHRVPGRLPAERVRRRVRLAAVRLDLAISTATSPSAVSCTSTQPISAGATVSTGRSKNSRGTTRRPLTPFRQPPLRALPPRRAHPSAAQAASAETICRRAAS